MFDSSKLRSLLVLISCIVFLPQVGLTQLSENEIRQAQLARLLDFQNTERRTLETRTRTYTVQVPYTEQIVRQIVVPVRIQQQVWEPAGPFGRRMVLRCREVTILETRNVVSIITRMRNEVRTQNFQVELTRYEKQLDDPSVTAVNGEGNNGVTVDLGTIPAASGPTFERMRRFFDTSTAPGFGQPKKTNGSEELLIHSYWTLNQPAPGRQSRLTIAATPIGNKIYLTVRAFQVLATADPQKLVADDFLSKDPLLEGYVEQMSQEINQEFKQPTN